MTSSTVLLRTAGNWWWASIWELVGLFLVTGGLAGVTYLLAAEGEPVLASVAFGGYLVALVAWVFGLIAQAAAVSQAATQRTETGETPAWIHPFWAAGYLAGGAWIIGTNLAYAVIGVAILRSGLVGTCRDLSGLVGAWSGWATLGLGALIPVVVLLARVGFPQLGPLVPFTLGVALVIEGF